MISRGRSLIGRAEVLKFIHDLPLPYPSSRAKTILVMMDTWPLARVRGFLNFLKFLKIFRWRLCVWQISPFLTIWFKIDFESNCHKWTAFPDTESPPKYFILEKFRKPMACAKGRVSFITNIVSARELVYERGRSWIEHPRAPNQRSASTNHDMIYYKHYVLLFQLLS